MKRSLISINDLSNTEIEGIFDIADEMDMELKKGKTIDLCRGKIMSTLFYEPSTRTRLSFESAMLRLGGSIISTENARETSSSAKGETIKDTIRVIQNYADIIVMRHYLDGSTKVAAECSKRPVISGGDGSHEHPTQTLCDLYTIRKEKGRIKGLNVALCGDLRYGRTIHSLAYGLARFGANISCIAPKGFEIPNYVKNRLEHEYDCNIKEYSRLDEVITHEKGTGKTNFYPDLVSLFDVLYLTRIQKERFVVVEGIDLITESFRLSKALLSKAKDDTLIMHPLPRVNELEYKIDEDKRAGYFRQASYGVVVRMAITSAFLGKIKIRTEKVKGKRYISKTLRVKRFKKLVCRNENCVTNRQADVSSKFVEIESLPDIVRCYYCEYENIKTLDVHRDDLFARGIN